jgi:protein-S-isoprenylcysteine O-methyltransferase Ste14
MHAHEMNVDPDLDGIRGDSRFANSRCLCWRVSSRAARSVCGLRRSTLVTEGLYGRIRNPIYVFGGLMIAGVFIFAHRPWWLLIFAVVIPIQLLRVRKEEQVLEAKFGDGYREYKRKTWF